MVKTSAARGVRSYALGGVNRILMMALMMSAAAVAVPGRPAGGAGLAAPVLKVRSNESLIASRRERCVWSVTRAVMGAGGRLAPASARVVVTVGRQVPLYPVQPLPRCPVPAALTVRN